MNIRLAAVSILLLAPISASALMSDEGSGGGSGPDDDQHVCLEVHEIESYWCKWTLRRINDPCNEVVGLWEMICTPTEEGAWTAIFELHDAAFFAVDQAGWAINCVLHPQQCQEDPALLA